MLALTISTRKIEKATESRADRPRKLTPKAVGAIVNVARKPRMTARKEIATIGLKDPFRTFQRALSAHEHM